MGDHGHGSAPVKAVANGSVEGCLALRVEIGVGLIEDEKCRITIQRPS
jgi:hypothetical protein